MDPIVLAVMQLATWVGAPFVGRAVEVAGTKVGEYFGGRVTNVLRRVYERSPDPEQPDQMVIQEELKKTEINAQVEQAVIDGLKKIICDRRVMWLANDFDALYFWLEIDREYGPPSTARPYSDLPDLCTKGRWLVDWAVGRGKLDKLIKWLMRQRPHLFEE